MPRTMARALALLALLATACVAASTASASGGAPASPAPAQVRLSYTCRSASGPEHVTAQVTAAIPATATAGKPVRPGTARVALTVPRQAVTAAAPGRPATITATARLTTVFAAGSESAVIGWPGLTVPRTPLPARGALALTASGAVPSVTPSAPGQLTVTAAGLALAIAVHPRAARASPGPDSPAAAGATTSTTAGPAAVRLACSLAPGQNATLGVMVVTGSGTPLPPGRAAAAAAKSPCPKLPPGGLKLNPRFPPPPPPPGSTVGSAPSPGCAYTTGYADARKLKGAALIQPALTNVDLFVRTVLNENPKVNYFEADNAAELDYHGQREFPPSTATFLTFGFVPTTAAIELIEHGTINIFAIGPALPSNCKPHQPCNTIATVSSRLSVQIVPGSVTVNGTPLDVGSHCETAPFDAILTGSSASKPPYNVVTGGPLTGLVDIPPFSNCGVGENLDPLFNAAISGSRNFNLLTQGPVCFLVGGGGVCPPPKPTPLREVSG